MTSEAVESDTRLDPRFPFRPIAGGWEWLDVPANPAPVIDSEKTA